MAHRFSTSSTSYLEHRDGGQSDIESANSPHMKASGSGLQQSLPEQRWGAEFNSSSGQEKTPTLLPSQKPSQLSDFFPTSDGPRLPYTDRDMLSISQYLRESGHLKWSEAPRLYTVLRTIGQLQILEPMLDEGFSDIWFPFKASGASSVPTLLSASLRAKFLEVQPMVLTKAVDLEKSDCKKHKNFGPGDSAPFETIRKLGRVGSGGKVDEVFSLFSRRHFAQKRFLRYKGHGSKREMQSFVNELQVLKKIDHHHCIELVSEFILFY